MKGFLRLRSLKRSFGREEILKGIDYSFPSKGLFGIVGPSGCGKSTLLNVLSGLDVGYQGEAVAFGKDWKSLSEEERSSTRLRHFGYVFQSLNLLELETVRQNILFPIEAQFEASRALKNKKVQELLSLIGLSGYASRRVNALSGGEKQRVAFARALSCSPEVLLCDEPTGALDSKNAEAIFSLMHSIARNHLVIVVSHDEELAKRHCDHLLFLDGGRIVDEESRERSGEETVNSFLRFWKKKRTPRVPFLTWVSHSASLFKAKRWRSLLSEASISIGLLGIGLSSYVSSSISSEISGAFSSLVPTDCVAMSPKNEGVSAISNVYSAPISLAKEAVEAYPDLVKDWGSSFEMNFEEWFRDENALYAVSGASTIVLPGFSVRSVNDFLWLDETSSESVFPYRPLLLGEEEIVLGLPYATMFNLCFGLHIQRNYQALGDFIRGSSLRAVLMAAREEWGFKDEETFFVKGVVSTESPTIFHTDHRWSEKILLDHMRFVSSQSRDDSDIQTILEIPYLVPFGNPLDLVKAMRNEDRFASLVLEKATSDYLSSICPSGKPCGVNRLYAYCADKNGISYETMDRCGELCPEILGRTPVCAGSFYANASSYFMGFLRKFFLCASQEAATQVSEAYSSLPSSSADNALALPDGVKDGGLLTAGTNGLRIRSDGQFDSGRAPASLEEVVLSSSLFESWGSPEFVYVAAEIDSEEIGGRRIRTFSTAALKVVGTKKESSSTMHVVSDWTSDYFFAELGMSPFYLEPYGAVFYFRNQAESKEAIATLEKQFPNYSFSDPGSALKDSVSSTTNFLGTVLSCFSSIALLTSLFLFLIMSSIAFEESRAEERLFFAMGISRKDIARGFCCQGILSSFGAAFASSVGILICEAAVKGYLSSAFGSLTRTGLDGRPVALILAVSALFSGLVGLVATLSVLRGDKMR